MKLYIAADHAGYEAKQDLMKSFTHFALKKSAQSQNNIKNIEWVDVGAHSAEATDYPINSEAIAKKILSEMTSEERYGPCGVIICGSGIGVSIAANRFKGIRAVLALDTQIAEMSRKHNAANVICFGSRVMTVEKMKEVLAAWLATDFEGKGIERHERRVQQLDSLVDILGDSNGK